MPKNGTKTETPICVLLLGRVSAITACVPAVKSIFFMWLISIIARYESKCLGMKKKTGHRGSSIEACGGHWNILVVSFILSPKVQIASMRGSESSHVAMDPLKRRECTQKLLKRRGVRLTQDYPSYRAVNYKRRRRGPGGHLHATRRLLVQRRGCLVIPLHSSRHRCILEKVRHGIGNSLNLIPDQIRSTHAALISIDIEKRALPYSSSTACSATE